MTCIFLGSTYAVRALIFELLPKSRSTAPNTSPTLHSLSNGAKWLPMEALFQAQNTPHPLNLRFTSSLPVLSHPTPSLSFLASASLPITPIAPTHPTLLSNVTFHSAPKHLHTLINSSACRAHIRIHHTQAQGFLRAAILSRLFRRNLAKITSF